MLGFSKADSASRGWMKLGVDLKKDCRNWTYSKLVLQKNLNGLHYSINSPASNQLQTHAQVPTQRSKLLNTNILRSLSVSNCMLNIAMIWTVWQTACKNVNIIAFFYLMRVNTHPVSSLHRRDSSQLMRAPVKNVCCGSSFKASMWCRKDSKGILMQLSLFLGLYQVLNMHAYLKKLCFVLTFLFLCPVCGTTLTFFVTRNYIMPKSKETSLDL